MRAQALEQLFVKRRAGRVEFLMVFESPAGGRERRTLATPATDDLSAMAYLANYLQRDGSAVHQRLRVRRERGSSLEGSSLEDAPQLKAALLSALAQEGG